MAIYHVICVNKTPSQDGSHEHIAWLGLGDASGWQSRVSVGDAIHQLRSPYGDRYYTISPTTGTRAEVIEGDCEVCHGRPYVRTTADGIRDNNLSKLDHCRVS